MGVRVRVLGAGGVEMGWAWPIRGEGVGWRRGGDRLCSLRRNHGITPEGLRCTALHCTSHHSSATLELLHDQSEHFEVKEGM